MPVLVCAAAVASCEASPREQGIVARVEEWTLDERRLADLLVLAQPFPLERAAVHDLARHWVGVAALARRAAAAGDDLTGEEAFRESMWLELREALLTREREERLGSAIPEPDEEDFRRGRRRLLAHVLRRVGHETSDAERELQRRAAERLLTRLREGGSWMEAVAESEDPATRDRSGFLGVFARGELPPRLDRAAFSLEPGQVSSVIPSDAGFHILYRPRYEEVAELYARRVRERLLAEADRASAEGLLARRGFEHAPAAVAALRRTAEDPLSRLESDETMAFWEGGRLDAGTVGRYVAALPGASREEMTGAGEGPLVSFLREVAVREIRIRDARERGLAADEAVVARFRRQHTEEVRRWMDVLGIAPGDPDARQALRRYLERAVSRRVEVRPVPPLFEAWLLAGLDWSLDETAVASSLAGARSMLEAAVASDPPAAGAPAGDSDSPGDSVSAAPRGPGGGGRP